MNIPLMMIILCSLAVAAQAQTLKWTQTPPSPSFPQTEGSVFHLRADAVGNCAAVLTYRSNGNAAGLQVVWYTAAGKLLHFNAESGAAFSEGHVVSVSPAMLVVCFAGDAGAYSIRKYTRRGNLVTFKDTPLGAHEFAPQTAEIVDSADRLGFFVLSSTATTITRYTLR